MGCSGRVGGVEQVRFAPGEAGLLADFLTGHEWPFHSSVPDRHTVLRRVADGHWDGPGARTFWLLDGARRWVLRLFDLDDGGPMFDLLIGGEHRGHGFGSAAVGWLTRYLFGELTGVARIEATTRPDNVAMRAVLRRHGYVKEGGALPTGAWPAPDGMLHDGVGHAVLREDHERGITTPVRWFDDNPDP